jgi:hypothetical protein
MKITEKEWAELTKKCPEIKAAYLHQAIMLAGVYTTAKTLELSKFKDLKLYWRPEALYYEIKGHKGVIPAANVANIAFDMDDSEAKAKSA